MDYRAALVEFYQKHNPEKLKDIDLLLTKYKGREEELLHALKVKYGVHKTATQAQPPQQPRAQPRQPFQPQPQSQPKVEQPSRQQHIRSSEKTNSLTTSEKRTTDNGASSLKTDSSKGKSAAERAEYWKKELEKKGLSSARS